MKKIYELKQDILWYKKGERFWTDSDGYLWHDDRINTPMRTLDSFQLALSEHFEDEGAEEYFELVDDRWRPELNEDYYYLDDDMSVSVDMWIEHVWDKKRFNNYNVFKTESEAKQARDKVLETLKKFHEGK